jgi:hypothetical protein
MKWQKLVIYFGISMFLISCGKKKEATKSEPAAEAPAAPVATDTKPVEVKPEDKKVGAENAGRGNVANNRKNLNKKDSKAAKNTTKKSDKSGSGSSPKTTESSTSGSAAKAEKKSSAASVAQGSVPLTDGVSNFGLLYTGAADDGILGKLVAESKDKSAEQQKADKALAISIFDISYLVDRTGQLTIDMSIKNNGITEERRFQMPFEANDRMALAHSPLRVTAECIDADKFSDDCSNLLVGIEKDGAQAMAILRQTKANLWYQVNVVDDEEYNELVQFLRNSKLDYETDNKVDQVYLNTFEVVGGKSGYTAVIMGKAKQVISLKSDLLVKKDLSASLNDVEKATDWDELNLFMTRSGKDLRFMNMFKSATLTQNNGKGQITVDMNVESKVSKAKNKVILKFTRKAVPARL